MRSQLKRILIASSVLALSSFNMAYAQVETINYDEHQKQLECSALTFEQQDDIIYFLDSNSVPQDKITQLMQKICAGEEWDSMKSGIEPVSISKKEFDSYIEETRRFSDGSVIVSETPIFSEIADSGDKYVTGCVYERAGNYAAYWRNCQAIWNLGLFTLFFTFDYSNIKDVGSRIDSFSSPGHGSFGNITDLRTYRVANNKVQCVGTWVIGPWASTTIGFNLETTGSNAYTYGL